MGDNDDHDTAGAAAPAPTPAPASRPQLGEPGDLEGVRRERDAAAARVRQLEHELGELRGKVRRMELMMWRRTARRQRFAGRVDRVRSILERAARRADRSGGRRA